MTKLKNSNLAKKEEEKIVTTAKTQIVKEIKMTVVTEVVMTSFSKNTLTPSQPTNSQGSFSQLLRCFTRVNSGMCKVN